PRPAAPRPIPHPRREPPSMPLRSPRFFTTSRRPEGRPKDRTTTLAGRSRRPFPPRPCPEQNCSRTSATSAPEPISGTQVTTCQPIDVSPAEGLRTGQSTRNGQEGHAVVDDGESGDPRLRRSHRARTGDGRDRHLPAVAAFGEQI